LTGAPRRGHGIDEEEAAAQARFHQAQAGLDLRCGWPGAGPRRTRLPPADAAATDATPGDVTVDAAEADIPVYPIAPPPDAGPGDDAAVADIPIYPIAPPIMPPSDAGMEPDAALPDIPIYPIAPPPDAGMEPDAAVPDIPIYPIAPPIMPPSDAGMEPDGALPDIPIYPIAPPPDAGEREDVGEPDIPIYVWGWGVRAS